MTATAPDAIVTALRLLETEYDQLTARCAQLENVMSTLRALVDDEPPAPAPSPPPPRGPAPASNRQIAAAQARAKARATCDICGKEVSAMGLGTHRRTAHGVTSAKGSAGPGRWPTNASAPASPATPTAQPPAWTPERAREHLEALSQ